MTDRAEEARQAIAGDARRGDRARLAAAARAARPGTRRTSRCAAGTSRRPRTTPAWPSTSSTTTSTPSPAAPIMLLLYALAERGEFERGPRAAAPRTASTARCGPTRWEIGIRHARARLWLAEGDFERAHAEACEAGALREQQGRRNPSWTPWRSTAALALAHLGRREEAAALADAEVALAERFGAPVPIAHALHARAVAEADDAARVALLRARAAAWSTTCRRCSQRVRLRLELGSALARMGRRIEARGALRPALADADAVGRRAAGPARAPRARGDRAAPAPGGDRGRRGADAAPAPGLRAGRRRQGQPRDRPGAVPEHQDRRGAPRGGLPQARRQRPRRPGRPSWRS